MRVAPFLTIVALVGLLASSLRHVAQRHGPNDSLMIAIATETGTLDPVGVTDVEWTPASQIYETLVKLDTQGGIKPGLALSWERQDLRTWIFHLRPGVQFQDGSAFDAAAAQFSLRRATKLRGGWQQLEMVLIEVVDTLTLSIRTARPFAPLPVYLAYINYAMVSPLAARRLGVDFTLHPVGTGPFVLKEYVPGQRATLVRNEKYWGTKPRIVRVEFTVIPDSLTRVMALESGQIDLMRAVPLPEIPRLRRKKTITVLTGPGRHMHHLAFNRAASPFQCAFDDVRVRRALNYAIDRQAIVDVVLNGAGEPATGPVPLWVPAGVRIKGYPHDPAQARRLLAEAGWRPGALKLRYIFSPGWLPQNTMLAELLQAQLREVGIELRLEPMEFGGADRAEKVGETDLRHRGIAFLVGGAYYGLWSRYSSANSARASVHYSNPAVDALFDCAEKAPNTETEAACLAKVQRMVSEDAADVPLYYEYAVVAAAKHVTGGFVAGPGDLVQPDLKEVSLERIP
jgi:peptide/nickel transport system substrate-binding protein